ncbi:MAG: DUF3426 domain-containing protein, partial [Deltaproteobacteria bacterium]|nr:DUF3426 domain-containing protein [Deltaproteobacteria bacterium]
AKKQEITDAGVRRLTFKSVNGAFAESGQQGQLFVIRGVVANDYPNRRSFILVKGTILDDKGKAVKMKVAYAGNTFTDEELKGMSGEAISQAAKNRFGKNKINFNIQPGGAVPFMIVFEQLPDNMSEFTVEAVSSTTGT